MKMTPRQYKAEVEAFRGLVTELLRENHVSQRRLKPRNNIDRRAYVRAMFAFVEGTLFRSKAFLLKVHPHLCVELSVGEMALLLEEAYGVTDQGAVRVRPQYLTTPDNVRFTFAILHRVARRKPRVDYGGPGWADFRSAVRIRNRIAHPKRLSEYRVTAAEVAKVERGVQWFRKSHLEFFKLTAGTGNKLFPAVFPPAHAARRHRWQRKGPTVRGR